MKDTRVTASFDSTSFLAIKEKLLIKTRKLSMASLKHGFRQMDGREDGHISHVKIRKETSEREKEMGRAKVVGV